MTLFGKGLTCNASTFNDVEQFLAFAASFIHAEQHKDDLVPRNHC